MYISSYTGTTYVSHSLQYAYTHAHPSPVAERCTLARIQVPHILAILYNLIN